ncbi:hypothetical protein [Paenisporosarcina indica]|uniref:hypothetical protein n=1 Tax=Paenisporosarcina indica TaxID=650093 RepID=UPI0009500B06|nr:hypothetical protein [Paenisporosarcina indica]
MNKKGLEFGQNGRNALSATQLDIIASAIVTFGDALGTVAAVLALEAEEEEEKSQENQEKQLKKMQKQIDYLTSELFKLKSQMP